MTVITGGFPDVFPMFSCARRPSVAGGAVGLGVGTAGSMARDADRCADDGRSAAQAVAGGALGGEIARCGNRQVVVKILYCVSSLDVVTVVTGGLVGIIEIRGVAVYAHLGLVSGEGFVFR